jgi:hypothetical protein
MQNKSINLIINYARVSYKINKNKNKYFPAGLFDSFFQMHAISLFCMFPSIFPIIHVYFSQ